MAQVQDDTIPVPMGNGTTDKPYSPQEVSPQSAPSTDDKSRVLPSRFQFVGGDKTASKKAAPEETDSAPAQSRALPSRFTFTNDPKATSGVVGAPEGTTATPGFLDRTNAAVDSAMNKALAPNPQNLAAPQPMGKFGEMMGIPSWGMAKEQAKTLGREVKTGAEAAYGMPKAMYHAVADAPTAGEQAEQEKNNALMGLPAGTAPGRVGLAEERMLGVNEGNPLKAYGNAATRPTYEQVLENAPEALGQGAGTVLGGEAMGRMGGALKEGMQTPGFKEVTHAPIRAASRVAEHVAPAAPVLGEVVAGFPGLMAARTLKGTIADIIEKGKVSGLPKMEANATVLEGRAATAAKAAAKTQADADLYKASHVPEEVDKVNKKAQAAAQDAQFHADAARQAVEATKPAPKTVGQSVADIAGVTKPETPAAQMTAKPAAPAPAPAPMEAPEVKPPVTLEQGPGKLATPEPEPKAAPTVPPVKAADLERQIKEGLGNKPIKPGVKIGEQGKVAAEPEESTSVDARIDQMIAEKKAREAKVAAEPEVKLSSRPDKAMLQKAKATPEEIDKILPLTKVELSKLAGHFDVDLGDKAIGREKIATGTKIPREEVLQKIVDAGHTTADIAKAIDEGKHLPTVGGGTPDEPNTKTAEAKQVEVHNANGGSTFDHQGNDLNGKNVWSIGERPDLTETVKGDLTPEKLAEFKAKNAKVLDNDHAVGTWKNDAGEHVLDVTRVTPNADEAEALGRAANQQSIYHLGRGELKDTGGTGEMPKNSSIPTHHTDIVEAIGERSNRAASIMKDNRNFRLTDAAGKPMDVFYSLDKDNLITGVINKSGEKGMMPRILEEAKKNGGVTGMVWDGNDKLLSQYKDAGFEESSHQPYDEGKFGAPSQSLRDYWSKKLGWKEGDPYPGVTFTDLAERRATRRAPMNAAETEEAMKQRKPFVNPVDETHGAMDTINRDLESKGLGTPKAEPKATGYSLKADKRYPATTKYAAPEKGIPETSLAKGPEAEAAQTATMASDKLAEEWKKAGEEKPKAETEKFPPSSYEDKGNGFHEVITGPAKDRVGQLLAKDVDGSPSTVQTDMHWVAKDARGKGLGVQQLETLSQSLSKDKTTLLSSEEMSPSAEGAWSKFQKQYPDAVTKTDKGYSVDLRKMRGEELPPVGGGSQAGEAKAKENVLPKLAEEHMTPEEKAGVSKSNIGRKNFVDNLAKAPQLQEWVDAAKAGEGAKHWYQRSGKAFDALHAEAPKYFQEGDREKWGNFVAATSPQQMVHNNLHEALHAWTQWVDDGRPMDDKGMEKSLRDSIVSVPNTKVPNAMLALQGKDMWPTLDKNQYFKVPSFGKNLNGYLNHVTNDGWQALFGGLDAKSVSSPTTYHPLSVMTRAAADALGWKPAEAQAAIWSFTQALKERGEVDPNIVRQYSEDFADIMAHNHEIRTQLKSLGVDLGKLDTRLEAIGEKPEITPGTSATTEHSTRQLAERIETARGKGAIPPAKSAQGELNFREAPAGEGRTRVPDEATEFNPEKFRTQTNEPVMEKPFGKKKSPMKKMNV